MNNERVTTRAARVIGLVAAIGLALAGLTGCAEVPPAAVKRIDVARTKAAHDELAAYYEQEARTAQAKAQMHLDQAQSYRKAVPFVYPRVTAPFLADSCVSIANKYMRVADDNLELAKSHRDLASKAPE